MTEQTNSQQSNPTPAKSSNTVLKVILIILGGCAVILVVLVIAGGLFAKTLVSKVGVEKLTEKAIENAIEKESGQNVDVDFKDMKEGKFEIKGDDGSSFSTSTELPKDFPSTIPVISGATVKSSMSSKDNKNNNSGFIVVFSTSKTPSQVKDYYEEELPKKGWSVASTYSSEDSTTVTAEMGDEFVIVSVTQDDEGTVLSLTYSKSSN